MNALGQQACEQAPRSLDPFAPPALQVGDIGGHGPVRVFLAHGLQMHVGRLLRILVKVISESGERDHAPWKRTLESAVLL